MFGFHAATPDLVDSVHALALSLGAKSEGEPGPRAPSIYIAYFRDLDGNKVAIYHLQSIEQLAAEAAAMERTFLNPDGRKFAPPHAGASKRIVRKGAKHGQGPRTHQDGNTK